MYLIYEYLGYTQVTGYSFCRDEDCTAFFNPLYISCGYNTLLRGEHNSSSAVYLQQCHNHVHADCSVLLTPEEEMCINNAFTRKISSLNSMCTNLDNLYVSQ